MSEDRKLEMLVDDAVFGESPRWHAGALWFSDIGGNKVWRIAPDGSRTLVVLDRAGAFGAWLDPGGRSPGHLDPRPYHLSDGAGRRGACVLRAGAAWHFRHQRHDDRGWAQLRQLFGAGLQDGRHHRGDRRAGRQGAAARSRDRDRQNRRRWPNVVYYNIPELPFTAGISGAFKSTLAEVCPKCEARETPIPIATLGNTAPQTIVSDLQANPDTTVAMFPSSDMVSGLPSALKAAGIDIKTLQVAPSPPELEYLKEGKLSAGIAADVNVLAWTMMDSAARLIAGQELSKAESEGTEVLQFLTEEDITSIPPKAGAAIRTTSKNSKNSGVSVDLNRRARLRTACLLE